MNEPVYHFINTSEIIATFPGVYPIDDLEKEIGVYSATPEFVRANCGAIANGILDQVPVSYYERCKELGLFPNCDVRIHRLYPSDYPAYPGWHCDGEYRETYFSQPDLDKIPVSYHLTTTASSHEAGISNTQYLIDSFSYRPQQHFDIQSTQDQHTLWGKVNELLEKQKKNRCGTVKMDNSYNSMHERSTAQCQQCDADGAYFSECRCGISPISVMAA